MKRITGAFLCLTVVLLGCAAVQAHPGHDHSPAFRIWKDADGLFEMEASFVVVREGRVQLRKHDGSLAWVPLARLSPADLDWLGQRGEAIRGLNRAEPESDTLSILLPRTTITWSRRGALAFPSIRTPARMTVTGD